MVVVYTADHVEHLSQLSRQQFADVVAVWRDRTAELWADGHDYVMAFENHGSAVGATLPHLHGQIYALDHVPPVTLTKLASHARHRVTHDECLGCRLVDDDLGSERVVYEDEHFVAAVPFAPRWPLEVHVRAKAHGIGRLGDLDDEAALHLVAALSDVVGRYDGLWDFPLPYMMCVQEAPPVAFDGADDWHLHVELLPPHRNPQRLKVRASVETALGVYINDTLPESLAGLLPRRARGRARLVRRVGADDRAGGDRSRSSNHPVTAVIARAPGRVTLIGDHTDYTGGLCLPMAIDRAITITGVRDVDAVAVRLESTDEPDVVAIPLDVADPQLVRAGVGPLRGRGGGRAASDGGLPRDG